MKIRKAKQSDTSKIYSLGKNIKASKVNKKTVTFWPKSTLSKIIKSKNNVILVAEKNEKVIGYIIANYNPSFEKAIIENIYVDESRHKGVGTLLLNEAVKQLKKNKCKYICTFTKLTEKNTLKWFSHRGIKPGVKVVWSDIILSSSFIEKKEEK